jgi:chemotaxis signal transduction protein
MIARCGNAETALVIDRVSPIHDLSWDQIANPQLRIKMPFSSEPESSAALCFHRIELDAII